MKNNNFIYDSSRSGYSKDTFKTLLNLGTSPYYDEVKNRVVFSGAHASCWKDFEYGTYNFKMFISSTNIATAVFSFGLKLRNGSRYALFNHLADGTWTVSTSDGIHTATKTILIDSSYLDTETTFSINWQGNAVVYRIGTTVLYTEKISTSESMPVFISETTAGYAIELSMFEVLSAKSIYEANNDNAFYLEQQTLINGATVPKQAFTVVFGTGIITSNGHGLVNNDIVQVSNSGGALPAGLLTATNYYVISATTNTFMLSASFGGASVTLTDNGTGTQSYLIQGKKVMVRDYQNLQLSTFSSNSANLTLQVLASDQEDVDFTKAASSTNRWAYIEIIDLANETKLVGATGLVLTGTDCARNFEINVNYKVWVTAQITAYTAGKISVILNSSN